MQLIPVNARSPLNRQKSMFPDCQQAIYHGYVLWVQETAGLGIWNLLKLNAILAADYQTVEQNLPEKVIGEADPQFTWPV